VTGSKDLMQQELENSGATSTWLIAELTRLERAGGLPKRVRQSVPTRYVSRANTSATGGASGSDLMRVGDRSR